MEQNIIPKEICEKAKYCFECGICTASCPMAELLREHYNPRVLLQNTLTEPEKALNDENLWLCGWCYRCYRRCPQGLKPPEIFHFLRKEAAKRGFFEGFNKAISTIGKDIPLPTICWHTCLHPERAEMASEKIAESLEKLSKERAEVKKRKIEVSRKEKIAVIGSGPAGLTAACDLMEMGYPVTIFEALASAGGMLRKGIPEYRLPRKTLDDEIKRLEDIGIEIWTNTEIGKDLSFDDLWKEGYKAVFVATGAHENRRLKIQGEELQGVIDALDFLWKPNVQKKTSQSKKVAIIGGGNVAIDSARTALHQGAQEVTVFYRRSREEMPANPWETNKAEEEGVKIEFLVAPTKISGKAGKATGLKCVRMKLGERDETGRKKPVPIADSEFTVEPDTIIVAIGENPETHFLPKQVETDGEGNILINPITMETTMPRVYAGGDATTGPASVVEALLAGRRAADAINQSLRESSEERESQNED